MQITKKLIVTNTFWSAVAQVGVMGINLLVLPLFIKNLGAELYGIWVLSGVVLGYLNVFDFGFTQGLQKYVAEARVKSDHNELSEVVVTGTGLLFCIGLLIGGICFFGAAPIVGFFNIQPENQLIAKQLLQISALFCVVMWPLRIVDVVLNAGMRIKELSFLNAFKTGIQSVVMLGMVYVAADIVLIKWVTTILLAVCGTSGILLIKRYVPEINWNPALFRIYQLRRMHKFSLGMFYIAVLGLLSTQIDSLIIGKMIGMAAIAAYAVTSKLFQLIQRFTGMLLVALLPTVYNLNANVDSKRIKLLVDKGCRYRALFSIPLSCVAALFAPDFIRLWVGQKYMQYVQWAQLLCLVPVFTSLGIGSTVARGMGYIKSVNIVLSGQILLNFGLSFLLVQKYDIGGPILGTVIAVFLIGDFSIFPYFCRLMGIPWRHTFFSVVQMGFVSGILFLLFSEVKSFFMINTWLSLSIVSAVFFIGHIAILSLVFFRKEFNQFFRQGIVNI
jgi:O-antigen/teichoic acid export membrane protein